MKLNVQQWNCCCRKKTLCCTFIFTKIWCLYCVECTRSIFCESIWKKLVCEIKTIKIIWIKATARATTTTITAEKMCARWFGLRLCIEFLYFWCVQCFIFMTRIHIFKRCLDSFTIIIFEFFVADFLFLSFITIESMYLCVCLCLWLYLRPALTCSHTLTVSFLSHSQSYACPILRPCIHVYQSMVCVCF